MFRVTSRWRDGKVSMLRTPSRLKLDGPTEGVGRAASCYAWIVRYGWGAEAQRANPLSSKRMAKNKVSPDRKYSQVVFLQCFGKFQPLDRQIEIHRLELNRGTVGELLGLGCKSLAAGNPLCSRQLPPLFSVELKFQDDPPFSPAKS